MFYVTNLFHTPLKIIKYECLLNIYYWIHKIVTDFYAIKIIILFMVSKICNMCGWFDE